MAAGTTTRSILRQRLSEHIGDYESLTTSAAGDSGGTTLEDTGLQDITEDDDVVQGWILIRSGNNDNELRRIKGDGGYSSEYDVVTVSRAFTNQVATSVTFEWHRISPTDKNNAISRALEESMFDMDSGRPLLYLPIRDETIIVDDLLSNSDFETFSSGFTNWTEVGSPTVTKEATIVFQGSSAAKVISGAGAAGQLTQAPTINIDEMTGKAVSFEARVYATGTSVARIRLDFDGTNFESHAFHSGNDQWERQKVTATVPSSATQIKAICEVASGTKTAYFDFAPMWQTQIHRYTIPTAIVHGPHFVSEQAYIDEPDGPYYPINGAPTPGRLLRLEGMGLLTRPSSDTATTEIDGARVNIVVEYAAYLLYNTLAARSFGAERDEMYAEGERHLEHWSRLKARPGVRMPPMAAEMPNGTWHIEEDASGRYLVFDRKR